MYSAAIFFPRTVPRPSRCRPDRNSTCRRTEADSICSPDSADCADFAGVRSSAIARSSQIRPIKAIARRQVIERQLIGGDLLRKGERWGVTKLNVQPDKDLHNTVWSEANMPMKRILPSLPHIPVVTIARTPMIIPEALASDRASPFASETAKGRTNRGSASSAPATEHRPRGGPAARARWDTATRTRHPLDPIQDHSGRTRICSASRCSGCWCACRC